MTRACGSDSFMDGTAMRHGDEDDEDSEADMGELALVAVPPPAASPSPDSPKPDSNSLEAKPASNDIGDRVEQLFKKATKKTKLPGTLKVPIGNALKDYRLVSVYQAGDALDKPAGRDHDAAISAFEAAVAKLKESQQQLCNHNPSYISSLTLTFRKNSIS